MNARRAAILSSAELVMVTRSLSGVCRDPDDHRVLECASSGNADLIVSGDKDLLVLGRFENIRIVTPAQALDLIRGD